MKKIVQSECIGYINTKICSESLIGPYSMIFWKNTFLNKPGRGTAPNCGGR